MKNNNYAKFINDDITEMNKDYIRSADGVVTEIVNKTAVELEQDRDGSYEQAYSEYVSEEMNSIIANHYN